VAVRAEPLGEDRSRRRFWWPLAGISSLVFVETTWVGEERASAWGALSRPQELDELIARLNPRGCREAALRAALRKRHAAIAAALRPSAGPYPSDAVERAEAEAAVAARPVHPALAGAEAALAWDEGATMAAVGETLRALWERLEAAAPAGWQPPAAAADAGGAGLGGSVLALESAMASLSEHAPAAGEGEAAQVDDFADWAEPNVRPDAPARARALWQSRADRRLWRAGLQGPLSAARLAYAVAVLAQASTPLTRALQRGKSREGAT